MFRSTTVFVVAAIALAFLQTPVEARRKANPPPGGFKELDNKSIRYAVADWLRDPTAAMAKHGHISYWHVGAVTDFSNLFKKAYTFNEVLTDWDMRSATTLRGMFNQARKFNRPVHTWQTGNVVDMKQLFAGARDFHKPINAWDTSSVVTMEQMFAGAHAFNHPLNRLDVSSVTSMYFMFNDAKAFNQELNSWDTSNVVDMAYMFSGAESFNAALDMWNTEAVQDMSGMFKGFGQSAFNQDVSMWNTTSVVQLECTFCGALSQTHSVDTWQLGSVESVDNIFARTAYPGFEKSPCWLVAHDDGSYSADMDACLQRRVPEKARITVSPVFDDTSIRTAVAAWFDDATAAESTYGHISIWNVVGVKDFSNLFREGCSKLSSTFDENIGNWDLSSATTTKSMFYHCKNFNQDLSGWTQWTALTNSARMFAGCTKFEGINGLNNWVMGPVTDMSQMFAGAKVFNGDISGWDTSGNTDFYFMFSEAYLFDQPLNEWKVGATTDFSFMFSGAQSFDQPLDKWDMTAAVDVTGMFKSYGISSFNQDISMWVMGSVKTATSMLYGADKFKQDINDWDVSGIVNVEDLFKQGTHMALAENVPCWVTYNADAATSDGEYFWTVIQDFVAVCAAPPPTPPPPIITESIDPPADGILTDTTIRVAVAEWLADAGAAEIKWTPINTWNTQAVTDFSYLFKGAATFDDAIGAWNTKAAITMKGMFYKAKVFNQALAGWDLSSVTDVSRMFAQAEKFDQPLNDWNLQNKMQNVVKMNQMFSGATMFNQKLDKFDVSRIIDFSFIFSGCTAFDQNLNGWDVSTGEDFTHMFAGTSVFNSPLTNWDMTSAEDLTGMFKGYGTSVFNQPLPWDIQKVKTSDYMFYGAHALDQNFNAWLPESLKSIAGMFSDATLMSDNQPCWIRSYIYQEEVFFKVQTNYVKKCAETTTKAPVTEPPVPVTPPAAGDSHNDASIRQAVEMWFADQVGATAMYGEIGTWLTTDVTDMSFLFRKQETFNENIGGWDMTNVVTTKGMFTGCKAFTQDISGWDLSSNTNMARMFAGATDFNVNIDGWKTGLVTTMAELFANAKMFNQALTSWDTGAVKDMYFLFSGASSFNQDLNEWNVQNVKDFSYMFAAAESFNSPVDKWNTESAELMVGMYKAFGTSAFNQNVGSFKMDKVTSVEGMFHGANNFDHPLSEWGTGGSVGAVVNSLNFYAAASTTATPCWMSKDLSREGVYKPLEEYEYACADMTCRKIPGVYRGGRKVENPRTFHRKREYTCFDN